MNQDTVGARWALHDVEMKQITRFVAAAALVAFTAGASATTANAMMSTPPERLCGERSVAEAVEMLPATVGGPYVLNLQAICLAP